MFRLSPYLQKIVYNFSWLTFDQVLRAIVGILIARYLGKTQFGTYNFALAFVSLFVPLINFGFDSFIIRDIISHPEKRDEILGAGFILRVVGAVITFSANIIIIEFMRPTDGLVKVIVAIVAFSYVFQSFDVIDLYFRAQLKSKLTVWAKSPVFLLMNALKILCLIFHAPLVAFAYLYTIEFALGAVGMVIVYRRQLKFRLDTWYNTAARSVYTFTEGWPLFLAHISSVLYTYIDQVLIGVLLGDASVGGYSASAKFYQLGVVLIMMLTTSFFPLLTDLYSRNKELFYKRYRFISEIYTLISYGILIFVLLFANKLMPWLFGASFTESGSILKIQIVGFVIMSNAGLRSLYMTITSNQRPLLITTAISSVMNIILNLLLIPIWGVYGSAIATVLTQLVALLLLNLFIKKIRILFFIQIKAFLPILTFQLLRKRLKF